MPAAITEVQIFHVFNQHSVSQDARGSAACRHLSKKNDINVLQEREKQTERETDSDVDRGRRRRRQTQR